MKLAISVPDPVYRAAERAAKRMRVPRSRLYARAMESYLEKIARADVTERLNAVYTEERPEPDAFATKAAKISFRRDKW
jgi:hypothetical protein